MHVWKWKIQHLINSCCRLSLKFCKFILSAINITNKFQFILHIMLTMLEVQNWAGARQGGGRVVSWPPWNLEQGQWPPWISSMFWFFLWSNISRKQTMQYRKSTTTTSIIPVRYGAVNKWRHESIMDINKIYHSFGQHCLSFLSQRPDFPLIFKRLLSKSACLRGSAPDPAGDLLCPKTPSWKRLVLTTLLKNRSRATEIEEIQQKQIASILYVPSWMNPCYHWLCLCF